MRKGLSQSDCRRKLGCRRRRVRARSVAWSPPVPSIVSLSAFICIPGLCLLYTSDAADDLLCVDLGGRRIIKKKKKIKENHKKINVCICLLFFFFFKQKTAYEIGVRLVGSEMCIRDSNSESLCVHMHTRT